VTMEQNLGSEKWLLKFRKVIIDYTKNRTPDPFMIWFRRQDSKRFFVDDFERVLVVLIDARFDQRTTADKALQNTITVVKLGALKRPLAREELPLLIPRQNVTAQKWTDLFYFSLPKLHDLSKQIVGRREWDAAELLDFMLYDSERKRKVPYFGVKTVRLAVRWLHELVSALRIDMTTYKIPVDSLIYRVTCRLGIINPKRDEYFGEDSPADLKIQSFVKQMFPNRPYILDEPLWSTGRRAINGGHCFPQNPDCYGCLFESICPKKFLYINPEKLGMDTVHTTVQRKRVPSPEEKAVRERQAKFAKFVEELKQKGIKGKEYREKIAQWNREHRD
jgi:hypothetical protein